MLYCASANPCPAFPRHCTAPLCLAIAPLRSAKPLQITALPYYAFAYHSQTVPYFAPAVLPVSLPFRCGTLLGLAAASAFRLTAIPSLCKSDLSHSVPLPNSALQCHRRALLLISWPCHSRAPPRFATLCLRLETQFFALPLRDLANRRLAKPSLTRSPDTQTARKSRCATVRCLSERRN